MSSKYNPNLTTAIDPSYYTSPVPMQCVLFDTDSCKNPQCSGYGVACPLAAIHSTR